MLLSLFYKSESQIRFGKRIFKKDLKIKTPELIMKKFCKRFIVFAVILSSFVLGQTGNVSGLVSSDGQGLAGANVVLEGTSFGAAADAEGAYFVSNIQPGEYTVTVTYVGYTELSQVVLVNSGETAQLDFQLTLSPVSMDEVVVTALGIERASRAIGYKVDQISGQDLRRTPATNIVNALSGKTSGVLITSSGGQPGASARIVIRGESSINGETQPLFVVDGVPIANNEDPIPGIHPLGGGTTATNRAADIDMNNVESISVLKGSSATALYGSRASNGVILITTRKGEAGKFRINYSTKQRFDTAIIDGTQQMYHSGDAGKFAVFGDAASGAWAESAFEGGGGWYDISWGPKRGEESAEVKSHYNGKVPFNNHADDFYNGKMGTLKEHSIGFSGGSQDQTYLVNTTWIDQIGNMPGSSLEKLSFNARVQQNIFNDIESATSLSYINTKTAGPHPGGWNSPERVMRLWPATKEAKNWQNDDGTVVTAGGGYQDSPWWYAENMLQHSEVDRYILSQTLSYNFNNWATLTERVGVDKYVDTRGEHENLRPRVGGSGSVFSQKLSRSEINNDLMLFINDVKLTDQITLNGLVGSNVNIQDYSHNALNGITQNIADFFHESNYTTVTASEYESKRRLYALYGELALDYNDIFYISLSGRNDWASTLPKNNNSYFYPSLNLSLVFTDLLGFGMDSPLYFGKIRASFANVGSDAPLYSLGSTYESAYFGQWYEANSQAIQFPYRGQAGYMASNSLGNPNLKPEMTTDTEFGMDLRFFRGRLKLDFGVYNRTTKDQIYATPVPSGTGYTSMVRNAGEISNKGTELSIEAVPVETKDFTWTIRANYGKNKSEVVELAPGVTRLYIAGYSWPSIQIEKKYGYGIIFGYGYKRNDNNEYLIGSDGWPIVADGQVVIGEIQPDWLGNFLTNFRYKNHTVSALIDIRRGGDVLNFNLNYTIRAGTAKITEDRGSTHVWPGVNETTGQKNTVELTKDRTFYTRYGLQHENQVEDGSFVKLRELAYSYRFPQSIVEKTPFSSLSFNLSGRNLWIDTDFSMGDPEANFMGTDNGSQAYYWWTPPPTKSYNFGLDIGL